MNNLIAYNIIKNIKGRKTEKRKHKKNTHGYFQAMKESICHTEKY